MIKKTVTGKTEDLKLVKNGKSAPTTPLGGTGRSSFKGSTDKRAAGSASGNKTLAPAKGYIDAGPVSIGDTSFSGKWLTKGKKGSTTGKVSTAKESVTSGMGGKFIPGSKAK
jgi:hypothetical protein